MPANGVTVHVSSGSKQKWTRSVEKRIDQLRELWSRDVARRLATASFWSLAGAIAARVIVAGTWVLLARVLGKASLGQLGMVQSTVNMFAAAAALGLGITSTKHVAQFRGAVQYEQDESWVFAKGFR